MQFNISSLDVRGGGAYRESGWAYCVSFLVVRCSFHNLVCKKF
jgi:hypothetical protein